MHFACNSPYNSKIRREVSYDLYGIFLKAVWFDPVTPIKSETMYPKDKMKFLFSYRLPGGRHGFDSGHAIKCTKEKEREGESGTVKTRYIYII